MIEKAYWTDMSNTSQLHGFLLLHREVIRLCCQKRFWDAHYAIFDLGIVDFVDGIDVAGITNVQILIDASLPVLTNRLRHDFLESCVHEFSLTRAKEFASFVLKSSHLEH